jgi:hypothetical protein
MIVWLVREGVRRSYDALHLVDLVSTVSLGKGDAA